MARKNLFLIAASRRGPEDKLTEMVAYLWQERPELLKAWLRAVSLECADLDDWIVDTQRANEHGRFDLYLRVPEKACVIVESKLTAGLEEGQLRGYIEHLGQRSEPLKALVALTKERVHWSAAVDDEAAESGVVLKAARWQDVRATITDTSGDDLADDLADMLIEEGLVKPPTIRPDDWAVWSSAAPVLATLDTLIDESVPAIEALHEGLKVMPRNIFDERSVYRFYSGPDLSVYLGFSANETMTKPGSFPIIWAGVRNPALVGDPGKNQAEQVRDKTGGQSRWDFQHIERSKVAADVLSGDTFDEQVAQVAAFVYETAVFFRDAGFLPPELQLNAPNKPSG